MEYRSAAHHVVDGERAGAHPRYPSRLSAKPEPRAAVSADLITLERGLIEREAEAWLLRDHELALLDRWRLLEELERPRHVLDGEPVRDRRDQMDVDLRHQVAHHRQVEGLGHAGDLHPLRD